MADIDQIIAGGAGASTRANFSDLGTLLDSFYKGRDQKFQQEGRDLFKGGLPTGADGQPDWGAISKALIQHGDITQGVATANVDLNRQGLEQQRNDALTIATGQPSQRAAIVSPPSASRTASAVVAPPLNRGGSGPAGSSPQGDQPATVMTILAAQGIPNDQLQTASASVARQLGVDPTAPIDVQDPQVRNVLVPAVQQLKRMGVGQVVQGAPQGQPQPQAQPVAQMVPQAPQAIPQQVSQPSPFANAVAQGLIPPGVDPAMYVARLNYIAAASQKPEAAKAAKDRVDAITKASELTTEQRDFSAARSNPGLNDFTAQKQADAERAKGIAQNDVKEQQTYIDNGRTAQTRLGTLNTMANILENDKKMNLGFGAETALKLRMAAEAAGFNVGDLSGPQLLSKLGAALASESTKSLATRPTQFEFKTFMANNPGLLLDDKGNARMIGIMAQNAKREVELGKLARQNRDNWDNWDNVVEAYDKKFPIKDPTTGRALSNHTIIAPGPTKAPQAAPSIFSSPSEVHAAVAAGKLKSGDPFKTSDGRTKYVP